MRTVRNGLGRFWAVNMIAPKRRRMRNETKEKKTQQSLQEQRRAMARIERYPIWQMTLAEYNLLPKGEDVDLVHCPLGTRFICTSSDVAIDIPILGHVVPGIEAICAQYGAGLCVPERFINRYRLVVV